MSNKVTIVMPVYNREKYVATSIESILCQTIESWSLLILNDGSTDGTEDIIRHYLPDQRITYLSSTENRGIGSRLQQALNLIDTPYFLIVDSDDWIEPQAVELLLREMESSPKEVSLVCGNSKIWHDDDGTLSVGEIVRHRPFYAFEDFVLYGPMVTPRFFRTDSVRKVGGFECDDPSGGRFNEDRYLLYKLIKVSSFHHIDKLLYNIRVHSANTSKSDNQTMFNKVKKFALEKVLADRGLEPVFVQTEEGWLDVQSLKPQKI